jgi:hypothetical protein
MHPPAEGGGDPLDAKLGIIVAHRDRAPAQRQLYGQAVEPRGRAGVDDDLLGRKFMIITAGASARKLSNIKKQTLPP